MTSDSLDSLDPLDPLEPPAGAAALLFDCDGTLVDTLSLYRICWRQVFGKHGFEMADDWFAERAGLTVHKFVREAFPSDADAAVQAILDEGMTLFMDSIHMIEPLDHVVDVARRYQGRLPLAVVSSGIAPAVYKTLAAVEIADLFDLILTLADVKESKPAPDGYLLAVERLGVAAADCVAYEDSHTGIDAAIAAGIGTVFDVRTCERVTH